MPDFIGGLLIDLSLLGGIILLVLSFLQKFQKYKWKIFTVGLGLIIIGLLLFDTAAVSEAYQNGVKAGKSMIHN